MTEEELRERCTAFYDVLSNNASSEGLWRGYLQDVVTEAKLPISSRTAIVKCLVAIRSIEVKQTGNSTQLTVLKLLTPPSSADWPDEGSEDSITNHLTRAGRYDRMQKEIEAMKRQLGGLDIVRVLSALDLRIATIEANLDKIEKGLNGEGQEIPQGH